MRSILATCRVSPLIVLVLMLPSLSRADSGTEQIAMAASGRFDQMEKVLEAKAATGALNTKDRHALCYAYSKTRRYTQLMQCLDLLEGNIAAGDRRTRLFGLEDATPALGLMRAEALIETGQYARAAEQADKTLGWLRQDGSDDLDMVFNAMASLSIALTLSGDLASGQELAQQLDQTSAGFLGDYASAKAMALARARMALSDYQGVLDALRGDKVFAINVFLDRVASGSFLTGINNWVWAELPRAFMMNKALLETGQVREAKIGLEHLLKLPQVKENGEIYWLLLNDLGRIAELENQSAEALTYYRQAIEVVEVQRATINTEASKIGFVGDKQAVYAQAIAVALRLKKNDLAYEYVERSKSRTLVDLLASRESAVQLNGNNVEGQRLLERFQEAKVLAAVQLPLDMNATGGAVNRATVNDRAQALRKNAPELASLVAVTTVPLEEIRSYIQADEVLIEYFMHGKDLMAFAITQEQIVAVKIAFEALEDDIRKFRSLIEKQDPATLAYASKLYQRLLQPFDAITKDRNLVLISHGPLHYLPFSALHDGKGYLIAAHNLRYLPSASVQKYIRPRRLKQLEQMLILGNPELGKKELELPSAEDEALMIANMVPQSELLTRSKASETAFKNKAGNFSYLHIASHGQFNADNALQSRLLLASDAANDGSLTVGEIYGLHLSADLVTLSACETGLGKTFSGDDVIGLTRSFLYAGSSNIIASLWQVDDDATSELMKSLYAKLKANVPKKEALRQAQQELQNRFPDPLFWAAFYLTGEGQ